MQKSLALYNPLGIKDVRTHDLRIDSNYKFVANRLTRCSTSNVPPTRAVMFSLRLVARE